MWEYNEHQKEGADWALSTIREYGLAYLIWQERTRKTGTALLTVEKSLSKTCLIVTKNKALEGWKEHLANLPLTKQYTLINYESVHKISGTFDFIILDEAHHAISSIGKVSKTWSKVALFTKGKPILYLSATPYAETVGQLFHQFKLSSWSPFIKYTNYYNFHRDYGIPKVIYTSYGQQMDRSVFRVKEVLDLCEHLFSFKTRQDVGIEHEPTVNLIKIKPSEQTLELARSWTTRRYIEVKEHSIVGDSDSKMRTVHYQLEGGTLKVSDTQAVFLDTKEKVDYIKANYDTSRIAVMAHFIKERELLELELPSSLILSSDGHAEGVDLHKIDKLVIYSMSFKTSKHTQRLARQANHNRTTPIEVDVLVMAKPMVGLAVYDSVAVKKENFVKASYDKDK